MSILYRDQTDEKCLTFQAYAVHPPGGSTSVTTHPVNPSSKASCKDEDENEDDETEEDFFTRQARLQAEARMALAQVGRVGI